MDRDPEVRRYIGGPRDPVAHGAEVRTNIVDRRPSPYFAWAIEWKGQAGYLGQCVLSRSPLPDSTEIEIGWRLTRASWGKGIASEAAGAVLHHARTELGVGPVVVLIHPDNAASVRVAQKLGLRPAGETIARGGRQLVYRLD